MGDESNRDKKGGFWSGLFRRGSSAKRPGKLEKDRPRRASDGNVLFQPSPPGPGRRRSDGYREGPARTEEAPAPESSSRRRPRRPDPSTAKGKGREMPNGASGAPYEPGPLTEWPPSGVSSTEELSLGHAMELISRGVPAHKGHKRPIPHASDHYYALYSTSAGNRGDETDAANLHDAMVQLMTMRLRGPGIAARPWETLEQPSYAFCFGARPGTVTLNHWVSASSVVPPPLALRDVGAAPPRDVDLAQICARLRELQQQGWVLEEDDEDLMYRNLYRRFLRDPDKLLNPHRTLDRQITDLITVLASPTQGWIDFSLPRNQVATRFIFDSGHASHAQYLRFFHQLLLSVELDLRIHSRRHDDWAKEKLLSQLPPPVQWDLALSRRWRDYVRVDAFGRTADQVRLRFKLKNRQMRMLRRFARMMKWPNLAETLANMKQRDADGTLETISSHAMAFFSGLVLPGPTFPFLIMNALIDVDPDRATDDLALLTHLHPHCGFQYRNSYTYWASACIVGKVLAPTCREAAGWVGPARPTVDLGRSQIARVLSRRPRGRQQRLLTPEDARSMGERSDPLGPPAEVFPVREYKLALPDDAEDVVDTVRIELLSLKPADAGTTTNLNGNGNANGSGNNVAAGGPRVFDASIQFAIDGVSWPLRLTFDVSFVSAWPCSDGPHPLFFDYAYETVRADAVIDIRDWAGLYREGNTNGAANDRSANSTPGASGGGSKKAPAANGNGKGYGGGDEDEDEEKVLVVEAFGVPDNEVLARAWCAHWGLSAVVADVRKTCMACAIREAYAATLTVVILVEGRATSEDDNE